MAKRIDVKDLNVYYGDFKAVEGVSLTVEPRSVTAFIGPVRLRQVDVPADPEPDARGRARRPGRGPGHARRQGPVCDVGRPGAVRRTVGMVFQRPNPFPTMSIYDNVVAGLRLSGMKDKKALDEAAEKSLVGANLWNEVKDRLKKPGAGLSGGQQQRLCIARAIAVKPQVLLMDEPCSALDPISTLAIEDLVSELKADYTIVIVTHNMQQAVAGVRPDRVLQPCGDRQAGAADRDRHDAEDLQQPQGTGHRGLHQRPLRLTAQPR